MTAEAADAGLARTGTDILPLAAAGAAAVAAGSAALHRARQRRTEAVTEALAADENGD